MGQGASSVDDDKVYFFSDPGFVGTPFVADRPMSIPDVKVKGAPENSLSSLIVPRGYSVFLYQNPGFDGDFRYFRGPIRVDNLADSEFDNSTSSVIIVRDADRTSPVGPKQVAIFAPSRVGELLEGLLLEAPFDLANVTRLGLPNNAITELIVGSHVDVRVFDRSGFQGDAETFAGPYRGGVHDHANRITSIRASLQDRLLPIPTKTPEWVWWLVGLLILVLIIWAILSFLRRRR